MLEDIPEMVNEIGINTVLGLAEGMLSEMDTAVEAAERIASAIQDTFTSTLEISSPSRWADRVVAGETMAGLGRGFIRRIPALKADIEKSMETFKDISLDIGSNPFSAGAPRAVIQTETNQIKETHTKVIEKEKIVGLRMDGSLKQFGRVLKPSLDEEGNRKGRSLVVTT